MPKSRTTCTRCSMRRQKCDRKIPCTRCVRADVVHACTRVWKDYDARVHRSYPTAHETDEQDEADWQPSTVAAPLTSNGAGIGGTSAARSHDNETDRLQRLVPSGFVIHQLVEYYDIYLSWHHGGLVDMSAFRLELAAALERTSTLRLDSVDMRWCALVFAIMGASITSAPDAIVTRWSFSPAEQQTLSREWYDATLACLDQANYTARPHINSIQAIEILSLSAHVLGFSVQQYVLFGAALRMAQSLGLPKLCQHSVLRNEDEGRPRMSAQTTASSSEETSRRVWLQLCIHDWFSATSADMLSVNPNHCEFAYSDPVSEGLAIEKEALPVDFGNHLLKIGRTLAEFHDAIWTATDANTRYEVILKFDSKLRMLRSSSLPENFRSEDAPVWARWARSCATIIQANKIILVHRSFLRQSFVDERYTYSRWASVSAARTLVCEVEISWTDAEKPRMWNDQAHLVGASITLCLDMMHRSKDDAEATENRRTVTKALSLLRQCPSSTLASRGVSLIKSLLDDGGKLQMRHEIAVGSQHTLAWPLESREEINALYTSDRQGTGSRETPSDERRATSTPGVADQGSGDQQQAVIGDGLDVQAVMDMDFLTEMSWFNTMDLFPPALNAQLDDISRDMAPDIR